MTCTICEKAIAKGEEFKTWEGGKFTHKAPCTPPPPPYAPFQGAPQILPEEDGP